MKALMLVTHRGAADGVDIKEYKAGEVYDLPAFFYEPWVERGLCAPYKEDKQDKTVLDTKTFTIYESDKIEGGKLEVLEKHLRPGVSNKKLCSILDVELDELRDLKKQLKEKK